ncbi:hypothetical protein BGX20_011274, partial [Mortierella sp. AD010]
MGAQFLILNTPSNTIEITRGKYQHVAHFDVEYDIEKCVRAQPLKRGFFIRNLTHNMNRRPAGDGTHVAVNVGAPQAKFLSLISTMLE